MRVFAGIDEAGYGPMFGPLLVGRAVLALNDHDDGGDSVADPDFWALLHRAVCARLTRSHGRIAVNDSKKLHTPAAGIRHLERAVLAFAAQAGHQPLSVDKLLDCLGESCHRQASLPPWYAPTPERPWEPLPRQCDIGQAAVDRAMLAAAAREAGVGVLDLGAAVVFEPRFNRMVAATRSKAATSFTFVAGHLLHIWEHFGGHNPLVVVDRQSGRSRYRELLAMNFPEAQLRILDEHDTCSAYELSDQGRQPRRMTVRFLVEAEAAHLPTALASMVSKYVRELLMARFQSWFAQRAPTVKPTAGYAADAKRFWTQIQPLLPALRIEPEHLLRIS